MRLSKFAVAASLVPLPSLAQTNPDSPQAITVTATRVPTATERLPAGITIIDRKTIEERGYVSLADALSAVPGLRVVQSGGPGSQTSVFIRGTNSNHVLVLRDGVPINDPSDPGGAFNFGVDTLADIERIEVVRGPMSNLYGSGAVGGVINLITRHGHGAPHGHVTLAAGLPRAGLAQADIAGGAGIWDYSANFQGFSDLGFDQTPQRETEVYTGERDGDRAKLAEVELGASPFQDTRFSILFRARDAKYGYDEIGYDAGNATGYDASLFGRAGVTSKLLDGAWTTSFYVSGLQNDRRYTIAFEPADPNQAQQDDRYHGQRGDAAWNNTIALPETALFQLSTATFGYEHLSDRADVKNDDYAFGAISDVGLVKAHADSDAVYLGLQTTAATRLALTAQLREDATTIAGDAFTWRVGGVLALPEILSHIKISYGTSFRAPALADRYGMDVESYGFDFIGNPHLRPEYSQGFEAGLVTDLPVGRNTISLSAEYFHNDIRDLIVDELLPNGFDYSPINISSARTQGLETAVTLHASRWLAADLTYTYTDARDLDAGVQLLRRPYNQASADLRLSPIPSIVIVPELLYTGGFRDYLITGTGAFGAQGLSPDGLIFNLNASWQATQAVQFFVWGKNLGNARFEPVSGDQTPGASFLAGTRLGF